MPLPDTKPAHKSTTIQGAVVVILAALAQQVGLDFDEAQITEILLAVGTLAGAIMTIRGRWKADRKIKGI